MEPENPGNTIPGPMIFAGWFYLFVYLSINFCVYMCIYVYIRVYIYIGR